MWVLDQPYTPRAERLFAGTPLTLLALLAAGAVAAIALVEVGVLPPRSLRVVGVAAGHGALLAAALAWTGVSSPSRIVAVVLLALAAAAAGLGPLGDSADRLPAPWVLGLSACGRPTRLALGTPVPPRTAVAALTAAAGLA